MSLSVRHAGRQASKQSGRQAGRHAGSQSVPHSINQTVFQSVSESASKSISQRVSICQLIASVCQTCRYTVIQFISQPNIQSHIKQSRKDPLKFASLPTCGFVAQLVERPTSIWEARVQGPSKPEFFFRLLFLQFL